MAQRAVGQTPCQSRCRTRLIDHYYNAWNCCSSDSPMRFHYYDRYWDTKNPYFSRCFVIIDSHKNIGLLGVNTCRTNVIKTIF